jgi:bifunctional non-homologous end joining protein LigD
VSYNASRTMPDNCSHSWPRAAFLPSLPLALFFIAASSSYPTRSSDRARIAATQISTTLRTSPEATPSELIEAVREQGFEGIVAKRRASLYEPGKRSGAWQKMRVHQRREFTIGGYTPVGRTFDSILIGDYEGRSLRYVAKVRAGFTPGVRAALFEQFAGLETKACPFKNLPEARRGQWGEGLIAAEMEKCRWLMPRLIATIDYLERTAANHLRHPMFAGLTENSAFRAR